MLRKYAWSAVALFALTLLALDGYVVHSSQSRRRERWQARLAAEARILASEKKEPLARWVITAAQRAGARVTVEDSAGRPLAVAAPPGKAGEAGDLEGAAPLPGGGRLILALQGEGSESGISDLQRNLLLFSLACVLGAVVLTNSLLNSFARRAARLRTYIERLPETGLPDDELPSGDDEFGALARTLRQTSPKIHELLERLKLEGSRRESILSSMVEGVVAVDRDLRVIFCNRSFTDTLGLRAPVPEGIPLLDLTRDPALRDLLINVLKTGQPAERRIRLRGREAFTFEAQGAPLAGPLSRGALVILHEITELERLERVRKDFVANVSHELRTPLAAIRGYAETLLDGALEDAENNRKFVEIILAQSTRLNNIAADLLVISELESSGAAVQPQAVSVRSSLEAALRTVESAARVRGVKLMCGALQDVSVMGFEIRLEQAFVNLIDNAVKFNRPAGEVRIEMSPVSNGHVSVTIADTGIGIPSADLPRVFERFYRVDKARSRQVGGTGLGLSIVKHVVEQMSGSIRLESELGKGSRFTISLPVLEANSLPNVITL